MNYIEYAKGRTDEELKNEFNDLYTAIEVIEMFTGRDLLFYDAIGTELADRGYSTFMANSDYMKDTCIIA